MVSSGDSRASRGRNVGPSLLLAEPNDGATAATLDPVAASDPLLSSGLGAGVGFRLGEVPVLFWEYPGEHFRWPVHLQRQHDPCPPILENGLVPRARSARHVPLSFFHS